MKMAFFRQHSLLLVTVLLLLPITVSANDVVETKLFKEIASIDFYEQANAASSNNKTLMVMYVSDNCEDCSRMLHELAVNDHAKEYIAKHFVTTRMNVSHPHSVVCPDGLTLDESEFSEMKGISHLPTLIVHNAVGDMVLRHEGYLSSNKLLAFGEFVAGGHYLTAGSFERWLISRQKLTRR